MRNAWKSARHLIEWDVAASSLVWLKKDDGSYALIGVPLNVDGTRGEAPHDAVEWIHPQFALGFAIGIFGVVIVGIACELSRLLGDNKT